MTNAIYDNDFYQERHHRTVSGAKTILTPLMAAIPPVRSVIDVGCGVGTWLSVLKNDFSVPVIKGIDGPWVSEHMLEIPAESFEMKDLSAPFSDGQRFDLAISLEVAEHLSPESADSFVESLTSYSDFIAFSAAIPHQGGVDHRNEQWPKYWWERFAQRGFVACDWIRRIIWDDGSIPTHYRQNFLVYVKKERLPEVRFPESDFFRTPPLSLVHPNLHLSKVEDMSSIKSCARLLTLAIKRSLRNRTQRKPPVS